MMGLVLYDGGWFCMIGVGFCMMVVSGSFMVMVHDMGIDRYFKKRMMVLKNSYRKIYTTSNITKCINTYLDW